MLRPWTEFKRWSCVKCGKCCYYYRVPLTAFEATYFTRKYGEVVTYSNGSYYLRRRLDGSCVFLKGNLCSIHVEKPRSCRLWPFYIKKKPLPRFNPSSAEYCLEETCRYVYVDDFCRGLNSGQDIEFSIVKALNIYLRKPKLLAASCTV